MKKSLIFPGQGSQFPGMGKLLAEQFSEAREVFEEVDYALGQNLSQLMFEGPADELTLTANAQPALMAVSLAVLRVMEAQGFVLKDQVAYVAGHSLGEYSALCAAGMFSLADTARLLRIRGNAMQGAVSADKGAMAAVIGLEEQQLDSICHEVAFLGICQIANDNGGAQLVLSGEKHAVEHAVELARNKGAKRAVLLPVSAPFHSMMMQPAIEIMKDALQQVDKQDPLIPLIANISVQAEQNCLTITDLLVKQITGRVRWRETIEWLADHDVTDICEIGAGRVLSGLARRTNRNLKVMSALDAEEIENVLKLWGI